MKRLYEIFVECGAMCATPSNVMGMGNPTLPNGENVGSGDLPIVCKKKRKRFLNK